MQKVQQPVANRGAAQVPCTPESTTPPVPALAFWSSMACCWARCASTDGGGGCASCFCFSKKSVRIDLLWRVVYVTTRS